MADDLVTSEQAQRKGLLDLYSVPRRYDLATLFAVSVAYAVLFAFLRWTHWPVAMFILVAAFITSVGIAQALLFGGKRPRRASVLMGVLWWIGIVIYAAFAARVRGPDAILGVCAAWLFLLFGYIAGTLVGGVFLVAHAARMGLAWLFENRRRAKDLEDEQMRIG